MGKIVVITGSPSTKSRLNAVMRYVADELIENGCTVSHIEVSNLPGDDLLHANFSSEEIKASLALIKEAEAVIIATPVYKASYTGVLKAFIDMIPEKGLEDKKILPIAMGGTTAHLLMLEYALKPVLSVLGATQIENGVYIHDRLVTVNAEGNVAIEEEVNVRLLTAIMKFSAELTPTAKV